MARIYGTSYSDNGTFQMLDTYPGFPPRIRFFSVLEGTINSDQIYAGEGNDIARGKGGNDEIYGGYGDDDLDGGADHDTIYGGFGWDIIRGREGNDTLFGANPATASYPNPGIGEIDTLTGGNGRDTFVLGDATNIYYDDGYNPILLQDLREGANDYALITDFTDGFDTIRLKGGETYSLRAFSDGTVSGIGIYVEKGFSYEGRLRLPLADELIGVVQGGSLASLQINYGSAITTIT